MVRIDLAKKVIQLWPVKFCGGLVITISSITDQNQGQQRQILIPADWNKDIENTIRFAPSMNILGTLLPLSIPIILKISWKILIEN